MMELLLKNGRVVDPVNAIDGVFDVAISDGKIECVEKNITAPADKIIDCTNLTIIPGLCDMHVHLRDPGQLHKEDIITGCNAAAAGGVTAVACMPNTSPSIDSKETVEYILEKAKNASSKVYPVGAITKSLGGNELTDFSELKASGCVAVSDDGRPVKNAKMMSDAIALAHKNNLVIISHTEDLDIINGGIINEGEISEKLGVKGMSRASENYITAREILLAQALDLPVHIAHISTKEVVEIIRCAKKNGVKVTCETAPHYFTLTHEKLISRDADYRMNPPLREKADLEAITDAVCDGTVDCIITDHAPHSADEKSDFLKAPNGVVGLETSLSASYTMLVKTGRITMSRLVELMSVNPRKILGIEGGSLSVGLPADIAIFDENEEWTVEPQKLNSKSKNTCFKGMSLTGRVKYTILDGKEVYKG